MSASVEDLLVDYCAAIDTRADAAGIATKFWVEDGVLDNGAIGSPLVQGRSALADTFAQMFAAMEVLDHRVSNVRLTRSDERTAEAEADVAATGCPKGGESFGMTGAYRLRAERTEAVWKLCHLTFTPDT